MTRSRNNNNNATANTQKFGCEHPRLKTSCARPWLSKFTPFQRFITAINDYDQPTSEGSVLNVTDLDRRSNGQVKNFYAENEFLQSLPDNHDVVLYTGAAPGYHLYDLAYLYPKLHFLLHDNTGRGFAERLTQMPNIRILDELPMATTVIHGHIDDNLPSDAVAPRGIRNLRKWMPFEEPAHLREGASVMYPPCSSAKGQELKQTFDGVPAIVDPALPAKLFDVLYAMRHTHSSGNCYDCHGVNRCHTNYMRWSADGGNSFHPREPTQLEQCVATVIRDSFGAKPVRVDDMAGGHLAVKYARDFARANLHHELLGRKVVEAGPRTSHVLHGATEQVGWRYCHPRLSPHDKTIRLPHYALNKICKCKIEDCQHHSAEAAVLSDVYLDRPAIDKLLTRVDSIYWVFNNLPHGNYPELGINVSRNGGRYNAAYEEKSIGMNSRHEAKNAEIPMPEGGFRLVVATDSADKQYDDPDPFAVLKGLNFRVVYNNGIYVTVEITKKKLPPCVTLGDLGPFMDLSKLGGKGLAPTYLVHQVAAHVSPNELDRTHECYSRISKQFNIKSYDLASNVVLGAMGIIALNMQDKATAISGLLGKVASFKRVTHGIGAKILSILGELGEGAEHPFMNALKFILRAVVNASKGVVEQLYGTLREWIKWMEEKQGENGFMAALTQIGLVIAHSVAKFFEWLLEIPAAEVIQPEEMPEECKTIPIPDRIVKKYKKSPAKANNCRTAARNIIYSAAPAIDGVQRPVLQKTNNQENGEKILRQRFSKYIERKVSEPDIAIFKRHLEDVVDETTNLEMIEPLPFRFGLRGTRGRIRRTKSEGSNERTPSCDNLDSGCESSATSVASSRQSSSSQERLVTLSVTAMTTTELSSGPTSRRLNKDSVNTLKRNVSERMGRTRQTLSSSCRALTTSLKPTIQRGISTSQTTFSKLLTKTTAGFSEFQQKINTTLTPSSNPICGQTGISDSESDTSSTEPESQETSTLPSAIQWHISRLTELLQNCPDCVRETLGNALREMILSLGSKAPKFPALSDQDLMLVCMSGLDFTSNGDIGGLCLTWNSAAVSFAKWLRGSQSKGILGRFLDILLMYLGSAPVRNTDQKFTRSCFVKPWLTEVLRYVLQLPVIGGAVLDVPSFLLLTEILPTTKPPTPELLAKSQKLLDKHLHGYGGFLLTSSIKSNSISILYAQAELLSVRPYEACPTSLSDQEIQTHRCNDRNLSRWLCRGVPEDTAQQGDTPLDPPLPPRNNKTESSWLCDQSTSRWIRRKTRKIPNSNDN
jgi:hypothetical protein